MIRILIVEDNRDHAEAFVSTLEEFDCQTTVAHDHDAALAAFSGNTNFDLILLDLNLNNTLMQDGFEVCQKIRTRPNPPPIIMVTGERLSETDMIKGLDMGASDYITKPYTKGVLLARIKSVLRTFGGGRKEVTQQPQILKIDERLKIDRQKRKVYKDGNNIKLPRREFALLLYLADHPNEAFSRDELLDEVWGTKYLDHRTVYKHISGLRRKIEDDPSNPYYILTERGDGYKFRGR